MKFKPQKTIIFLFILFFLITSISFAGSFGSHDKPKDKNIVDEVLDPDDTLVPPIFQPLPLLPCPEDFTVDNITSLYDRDGIIDLSWKPLELNGKLALKYEIVVLGVPYTGLNDSIVSFESVLAIDRFYYDANEDLNENKDALKDEKAEKHSTRVDLLKLIGTKEDGYPGARITFRSKFEKMIEDREKTYFFIAIRGTNKEDGVVRDFGGNTVWVPQLYEDGRQVYDDDNKADPVEIINYSFLGTKFTDPIKVEVLLDEEPKKMKLEVLKRTAVTDGGEIKFLFEKQETIDTGVMVKIGGEGLQRDSEGRVKTSIGDVTPPEDITQDSTQTNRKGITVYKDGDGLIDLRWKVEGNGLYPEYNMYDIQVTKWPNFWYETGHLETIIVDRYFSRDEAVHEIYYPENYIEKEKDNSGNYIHYDKAYEDETGTGYWDGSILRRPFYTKNLAVKDFYLDENGNKDFGKPEYFNGDPYGAVAFSANETPCIYYFRIRARGTDRENGDNRFGPWSDIVSVKLEKKDRLEGVTFPVDPASIDDLRDDDKKLITKGQVPLIWNILKEKDIIPEGSTEKYDLLNPIDHLDEFPLYEMAISIGDESMISADKNAKVVDGKEITHMQFDSSHRINHINYKDLGEDSEGKTIFTINNDYIQSSILGDGTVENPTYIRDLINQDKDRIVGGTYHFWLRTVNNESDSIPSYWSESVSVVIPEIIFPPVPTIKKTANTKKPGTEDLSASKVTLRWQFAEGDEAENKWEAIDTEEYYDNIPYYQVLVYKNSDEIDLENIVDEYGYLNWVDEDKNGVNDWEHTKIVKTDEDGTEFNGSGKAYAVYRINKDQLEKDIENDGLCNVDLNVVYDILTNDAGVPVTEDGDAVVDPEGNVNNGMQHVYVQNVKPLEAGEYTFYIMSYNNKNFTSKLSGSSVATVTAVDVYNPVLDKPENTDNGTSYESATVGLDWHFEEQDDALSEDYDPSKIPFYQILVYKQQDTEGENIEPINDSGYIKYEDVNDNNVNDWEELNCGLNTEGGEIDNPGGKAYAVYMIDRTEDEKLFQGQEFLYKVKLSELYRMVMDEYNKPILNANNEIQFMQYIHDVEAGKYQVFIRALNSEGNAGKASGGIADVGGFKLYNPILDMPTVEGEGTDYIDSRVLLNWHFETEGDVLDVEYGPEEIPYYQVMVYREKDENGNDINPMDESGNLYVVDNNDNGVNDWEELGHGFDSQGNQVLNPEGKAYSVYMIDRTNKEQLIKNNLASDPIYEINLCERYYMILNPEDNSPVLANNKVQYIQRLETVESGKFQVYLRAINRVGDAGNVSKGLANVAETRVFTPILKRPDTDFGEDFFDSSVSLMWEFDEEDDTEWEAIDEDGPYYNNIEYYQVLVYRVEDELGNTIDINPVQENNPGFLKFEDEDKNGVNDWEDVFVAKFGVDVEESKGKAYGIYLIKKEDLKPVQVNNKKKLAEVNLCNVYEILTDESLRPIDSNNERVVDSEGVLLEGKEFVYIQNTRTVTTGKYACYIRAFNALEKPGKLSSPGVATVGEELIYSPTIITPIDNKTLNTVNVPLNWDFEGYENDPTFDKEKIPFYQIIVYKGQKELSEIVDNRQNLKYSDENVNDINDYEEVDSAIDTITGDEIEVAEGKAYAVYMIDRKTHELIENDPDKLYEINLMEVYKLLITNDPNIQHEFVRTIQQIDKGSYTIVLRAFNKGGILGKILNFGSFEYENDIPVPSKPIIVDPVSAKTYTSQTPWFVPLNWRFEDSVLTTDDEYGISVLPYDFYQLLVFKSETDPEIIAIDGTLKYVDGNGNDINDYLEVDYNESVSVSPYAIYNIVAKDESGNFTLGKGTSADPYFYANLSVRDVKEVIISETQKEYRNITTDVSAGSYWFYIRPFSSADDNLTGSFSEPGKYVLDTGVDRPAKPILSDPTNFNEQGIATQEQIDYWISRDCVPVSWDLPDGQSQSDYPLYELVTSKSSAVKTLPNGDQVPDSVYFRDYITENIDINGTLEDIIDYSIKPYFLKDLLIQHIIDNGDGTYSNQYNDTIDTGEYYFWIRALNNTKNGIAGQWSNMVSVNIQEIRQIINLAGSIRKSSDGREIHLPMVELNWDPVDKLGVYELQTERIVPNAPGLLYRSDYLDKVAFWDDAANKPRNIMFNKDLSHPEAPENDRDIMDIDEGDYRFRIRELLELPNYGTQETPKRNPSQGIDRWSNIITVNYDKLDFDKIYLASPEEVNQPTPDRNGIIGLKWWLTDTQGANSKTADWNLLSKYPAYEVQIAKGSNDFTDSNQNNIAVDFASSDFLIFNNLLDGEGNEKSGCPFIRNLDGPDNPLLSFIVDQDGNVSRNAINFANNTSYSFRVRALDGVVNDGANEYSVLHGDWSNDISIQVNKDTKLKKPYITSLPEPILLSNSNNENVIEKELATFSEAQWAGNAKYFDLVIGNVQEDLQDHSVEDYNMYEIWQITDIADPTDPQSWIDIANPLESKKAFYPQRLGSDITNIDATFKVVRSLENIDFDNDQGYDTLPLLDYGKTYYYKARVWNRSDTVEYQEDSADLVGDAVISDWSCIYKAQMPSENGVSSLSVPDWQQD